MAGTRVNFGDALRARDDEQLVALLAARPDLASPSPSTLRSLAARATSRAGTDHALGALSALELQVLEAVVVLGAEPTDPEPRSLARRDVAAALDPDATTTRTDLDTAVDAALDRLQAHALVWDAVSPATPASGPGSRGGRPRGRRTTDLRAAPGVEELLGPYPAGLAPRRTDHADAPRATDATLADTPPAARAILDALTWGPPVGVVPTDDPRAVAGLDWLLAHGLVEASGDERVVLPRAVALALRGGRTHRRVRATAPLPDPPARVDPRVVDPEAASAALEAVRLVAELVRAWEAEPPAVLRTGGLSQRDLRRLAVRLDTDDATAAFVAELALAAGLVVDDGELPATFVPTTDVDPWLLGDAPARWAHLVLAWDGSARTGWLAVTRDERGALRSALDPTLTAPWTVRLRGAVLEVLAAHPGVSLAPDDVRRVLAWRSPRAVPPLDAVAGVLDGARRLGVVAIGALAGPGRALLDGSDPAAALAAALPPEVDEILLQGDLTGVVPGRPSRALARLVDAATDVESRGSALSVRFTPASVTRALAAGSDADDLLAELERHSRTALPQPLEYLVRDAARRFGRVRVGAAQSYVRVDDPALARALVDRLRPLGVLLLAPTVLVAPVPAAQLHAALAAAGHTAALEGPDGRTVVPEQERARVVAHARRGWRTGRAAHDVATGGSRDGRAGPGAPSRAVDPDRLRRVVAELRARDDLAAAPDPAGAPAAARPSSTTPGPAPRAGRGVAHVPPGGRPARPGPATRGTTAPGDLLALLHEAISDHALVDLQTVDSRGVPVTRTVRPVRLDGGRLRAVDPVRDAELTVAVHRIAGVTPAPPRPTPSPRRPTA